MLHRALLDNCFRIIAIFINCNAFKIINYRNSLVSGLLKMGIWTIASRGKLPPPSPPIRVKVWVKVTVSFRVGGNQAIALNEN